MDFSWLKRNSAFAAFLLSEGRTEQDPALRKVLEVCEQHHITMEERTFLSEFLANTAAPSPSAQQAQKKTSMAQIQELSIMILKTRNKLLDEFRDSYEMAFQGLTRQCDKKGNYMNFYLEQFDKVQNYYANADNSKLKPDELSYVKSVMAATPLCVVFELYAQKWSETVNIVDFSMSCIRNKGVLCGCPVCVRELGYLHPNNHGAPIPKILGRLTESDLAEVGPYIEEHWAKIETT